MEQKHSYQNHEHVIDVLTNQYGFKYTGIGDNAEECFYKDSPTPETIFVHRMFCHYYMAESRGILAKRFYGFEVQTGFNSEKEQLEAFNKLCKHLDTVSAKSSHPKKRAVTAPPTFPETMLFTEHLWPLFRIKYVNGELPLVTALNALGLTISDYEKMVKIN